MNLNYIGSDKYLLIFAYIPKQDGEDKDTLMTDYM